MLGQAKSFFSNVSGTANGRSVSPSLDDSEDDRRTKLARAVETPMITKPKEVSPMFQQFLDGTFQIMAQYPTRFEYNERFLRRLLFHLYSCQYGTFLHNNDKERADSKVKERTRSVWDYFLARRKMWVNERYDPGADGREHERELEGGRVVFPRTGAGAVIWWAPIWGRDYQEMNGAPLAPISSPPVAPAPAAPTAATAPTAAADSLTPTPETQSESSSFVSLPGVSGLAEGVRGLALGVRTPSRKASREDFGTEMM